jgi:hypothetical protein
VSGAPGAAARRARQPRLGDAAGAADVAALDSASTISRSPRPDPRSTAARARAARAVERTAPPPRWARIKSSVADALRVAARLSIASAIGSAAFAKRSDAS